MNKEERYQYIDSICKQKNINSETKLYIKRYIQLNEELFGDFLDIDEVTERLLKNIRYNIKGYDIFKYHSARRNFFKILNVNGAWLSDRRSIYLNPRRKRQSLTSENKKLRLNSTIMHEMDHCATTKYVHISEEEKKEYISKIKQNIIEQEKNPIKRRIKLARLKNVYSEINGRLPISGIYDIRQTIDTGIGLRSLDEGIIAWKQEMYDKQLGIAPNTGYVEEKKVAKFVAEMIGKENLIKMHFNNDYSGIREAFFEKTGRDLNHLVRELNRRPKNPNPMRIMLSKIGINSLEKYFRESKKYSDTIDRNIQQVKKNGRTDFIKKYNIDKLPLEEIDHIVGAQKKEMINRNVEER